MARRCCVWLVALDETATLRCKNRKMYCAIQQNMDFLNILASCCAVRCKIFVVCVIASQYCAVFLTVVS